MKGADQCPECGSGDYLAVENCSFTFGKVRLCKKCKTAWEPFDPADLIDPQEPYESFKSMCDNCAFRQGSPERADKEKWEALLLDIAYMEKPFMCHKGVPIETELNTGHTHRHPKKADGTFDMDKMRYCVGWLHFSVKQEINRLKTAKEEE